MGRVGTAAMAVAWVSCIIGSAWAEPAPTAAEQAQSAGAEALAKSLHPQTGLIAVGPAHARLKLGEDYYFLPADDAKRVLTEAWGNPPDSVGGVLGMVFPKGRSFLDDSWAAVVTYNESGFVTDEKVDAADYDKVISDAQSGEADENAAREKAGFAPVHLVGWAQPPSYEKATHTLIWAQDIRFGDQADHTLNYDLRVLGRHGVLSLNMVSEMSKLPEVRAAAQKLRAVASFEPGAAFDDFQAGKDKTAGYGLAGLVAAGVGVAAAKKLGLLALILVFAKKGLVVIAAAAAGAFAWVRKKFGPKPAAAAEQSDRDDP